MATHFHPFEDRLSRDIRNELSEGLSTAVSTGDTGDLRRTIERFRAQQLASFYLEYIDEREKKYQKALADIGNTVKDPIAQAVILWNLGLFFEVHEVLEHIWYAATGSEKATLQALIRAAGVYIKLEHGYDAAATKIGAKAVAVLEDNRELLRPYFEPEQLLTPLQNLPHQKMPPKLSL